MNDHIFHNNDVERSPFEKKKAHKKRIGDDLKITNLTIDHEFIISFGNIFIWDPNMGRIEVRDLDWNLLKYVEVSMSILGKKNKKKKMFRDKQMLLLELTNNQFSLLRVL